MNLSFLMLYAVAAAVLVFVIIKTYLEKEKISKRVMLIEGLGLLCVVCYALNFVTDSYNILSAATSIMMVSQDFALVAILLYTIHFTRIKNKATKVLTLISSALALVDSVVFIINIFNEIALHYSMNMCDGAYVLGYEGATWFGVHSIIDMSIMAVIISLLVIKCMRIPGAYWGRYIFMGCGLAFILAIKIVFINKIVDLRFDISIFLYAFLGVLIYWNTFWYSKKTMLNITHGMIIDHMEVPVILFDYEGVLADFNTSMKELFDDLMYDNRDQTLEWFIQSKDVPFDGENNTFEWSLQDKKYDCRMVTLSDDKERMLGKIIVMQDVTALKKAYSDLEYMVVYDKLTGLFSKNSFLDHCKNYDDSVWPVAVIVSNVNGLGEINAKFGQREGDSVLVKLAEVYKRELKGKAYLARLDDGDFVAVIENTDESKANVIFDKIKKIVSKECSTKKYEVTIEYGIAIRDSNNQWMMDVTHEATTTMKNKKMMNSSSSKQSLVGSLAQTLTVNEYETEERVERTKKLALMLGEKMHLPDSSMSRLAMLAVLHDIGKIAIPGAILTKKDELKKDEWEIIMSHTERGYRIAKASKELEPIADAILSHHEKWDGSGYPRGLKGDAIPMLSRILSVVDAFDAMTHERPYHSVMTADEAIEEIRQCSGTQFDPDIVETFASMMKENKKRR